MPTVHRFGFQSSNMTATNSVRIILLIDGGPEIVPGNVLQRLSGQYLERLRYHRRGHVERTGGVKDYCASLTPPRLAFWD